MVSNGARLVNVARKLLTFFDLSNRFWGGATGDWFRPKGPEIHSPTRRRDAWRASRSESGKVGSTRSGRDAILFES
jgi:hypothetical protein